MKYFISAIQWVCFMIATSIAVPIAIASLFHLNSFETASFVQRTLLVLGAASFIQGLLGHRIPISEGPAGLWWVVFTIYSGFVGTIYVSESYTLQILSGAMIISAIFIIIITLLGLINKIEKLFTPTVTFIYLLLLILQLSGSFIKGILGITNTSPTIQPIVALLSIITIFLTFYLGQVSNRLIRQYSIILSLLGGWIFFICFGLAPSIPTTDSLFALPHIFVFGTPLVDAGTFTTGIFIGLLLTTNMITSVRVMEQIVDSNTDKKRLRSGGIISGINLLIGSMFSAVGSVPIAAAASFVSQTGLKKIKPFLLGGLLMCFIALFPPIINIMSSIPGPVCYAVSFVIFARMIGLAFSELEKVKNLSLTYKVSGIALLTGVGCMFLPSTATAGLPVVISTILNNGLVFGSIIGISTEQLMIRLYKKVQTN